MAVAGATAQNDGSLSSAMVRAWVSLKDDNHLSPAADKYSCSATLAPSSELR